MSTHKPTEPEHKPAAPVTHAVPAPAHKAVAVAVQEKTAADRREAAIKAILETEVDTSPKTKPSVGDLLRSRRALINMPSGTGWWDTVAGRTNYAQTEIAAIDGYLEKAGISVINGNVVPEGSTFNERTGLIDDPAEPIPGDHVWSKASGWVIVPAARRF